MIRVKLPFDLQIFKYGLIREKPQILQNNTDMIFSVTGVFFRVKIADIFSIICDLSIVIVPQSIKKMHEGGLAAAGRGYDLYKFSPVNPDLLPPYFRSFFPLFLKIFR